MSKPITLVGLEDSVVKQRGPASSGGTSRVAGDSDIPLVFGVEVHGEPTDLADDIAE